MPLPPGTRFGPYEVTAALGAGGMGEVYRAHDSATGRDVALKVLPDLFSSDPERLARFEREAKALGGLNHPNIAAIYGVEDRGPVRAIVMELVEGEDLSARISRGPIPLADAMPIVRQIADALSAAHDAGIVHRDLKPANVKVRDDGVVKVLDFGLAKAGDSATASGTATNSPTLTARATQLGMIIGTAAYMAPEQAKGKSVDKRADIWAFGVVFFEMLGGRRAFPGDDVSEVLASVLKSDPEWAGLPPETPASVRRLIKRCLEKDPRQRLRDLGEGIRQLDESPVAESAPRAHQALWKRAIPVAAAVAITALSALALQSFRTPVAEPARQIRFLVHPTADRPFHSTAGASDVTITPDGSRVIYTTIGAGSGGSSQPSLHIRSLDQFESSPLRGGEGSVGPFVSPDGESVAFIDSANLARVKSVAVGGGVQTTVATLPVAVQGGTWSRNTIVLGTISQGLFKVADIGGNPVQFTTLDEKAAERAHRFPSAVPGTDVVLFTTHQGNFVKLAAVNVATGQVVRFDINGFSPRYVASGHVVFVSLDGVLRAVPFDPVRMEAKGTPVPMLEGIGVKPNGAANFAVSSAGQLVYATGGGVQADRTVVWVDRKGKETPTNAEPRAYFYARVSPNGNRLSLDVRDQEADVWIREPSGAMRRVTQNAGSDQYGLWTPTGDRLIFQSDMKQKPGIYITRADGIGEPTLILERGGAFPSAVTADGKSVIFRAPSSATRNDLFLISIDGPDRTVTTLVQGDPDELNAALSPDGKWMAFESDVTGKFEVYVRPFPDVNRGQELISTAGGNEPVWAPGGREVLYVGGDNKIQSVSVTYGADGKAKFAAPVPLFDASPYFFGGLGRNYDVSIDGKRLIMVKNTTGAGAPAPEPIRVVLNWAEELKRVK